jgi:hypothetical protein
MRIFNFKTFVITLFAFTLLLASATELQAQKKKEKSDQVMDTLYVNYIKGEVKIDLRFIKGLSHNYPTFAVWIEDEDGTYIETLFVTEYISSGVYGYADAGDFSWKNEKGEALRPAALPYWSHKRNVISRDSLVIPTPENPVPDAISGATPRGNFILKTTAASKLSNRFTILMEINQTWDWNEFWTNAKFPNDVDYKTSSQPSIIYAAEIDLSNTHETVSLKPIGHGHYSGKDGTLYEDLSTFTTALEIVSEITVTISK